MGPSKHSSVQDLTNTVQYRTYQTVLHMTYQTQFCIGPSKHSSIYDLPNTVLYRTSQIQFYIQDLPNTILYIGPTKHSSVYRSYQTQFCIQDLPKTVLLIGPTKHSSVYRTPREGVLPYFGMVGRFALMPPVLGIFNLIGSLFYTSTQSD